MQNHADFEGKVKQVVLTSALFQSIISRVGQGKIQSSWSQLDEVDVWLARSRWILILQFLWFWIKNIVLLLVGRSVMVRSERIEILSFSRGIVSMGNMVAVSALRFFITIIHVLKQIETTYTGHACFNIDSRRLGVFRGTYSPTVSCCHISRKCFFLLSHTVLQARDYSGEVVGSSSYGECTTWRHDPASCGGLRTASVSHDAQINFVLTLLENPKSSRSTVR